jgi:hypothetical protein
MAGPVGFEPTILGSLRSEAQGSEGPRLGPGSTTGPAALSNLLALLLPWAAWLLRWHLENMRCLAQTAQKLVPRLIEAGIVMRVISLNK